MYKLSYYTIITKPIDSKNNRLAYATRTGQVVSLSSLCHDFLKNDLAGSIPVHIQEKLIKAGILVPAEENELASVINENIDFGESEQGQLNEVIQPSAMCQLGCYYCGQQHVKSSISDELVEKLVERIYHKFTQGSYKKIYIGWFGAEPLMGLPQMRAIYRRLTARIADPSVHIGGKIVTNGLSLKENIFAELVQELNVDTFEITLDGAEEYHDSHRFTKAGGPSFKIIYQNIKRIVSAADFDPAKTRMIIRCNVDSNNVEGVEPLIRLIADDNLHRRIHSLYFIGIYSWGGNDAQTKSLTKEQFARLKLQWEILQVKLGYPFQTVLHKRKKSTCMATGGKGELYDAFGNIFNCTEVSYSEFYEDKNYKLGTLQQDTLKTFDSKPHNDWYGLVRDTDKFPCHGCRLLPICGGSCPKSWVEGIPACPPYKFNIQKEVEFKYLLATTPRAELDAVLTAFENAFAEEEFLRYS
ncbi:radical SAM/SPASM domain-containing protein [Hymenobacter chitinivorans]|uniref:Radical SAM core domain-containing protein n=1 Tax=Hymenobacter chitinivorans DSM 11115 TaxID=1121954 RepID=A0A2M9B5C8_9BACT|nr:radical SAM protein [Hymenobacter chitinivorans]PJJ53148.1 uncharacterized protein CLV45_3806 [Hymenobacter chitinivorans DSM 11115]